MRLLYTMFLVCLLNCAKGQLLFSFERNYLWEQTECFKLGARSEDRTLEIEDELLRFDEPSIRNSNDDVFRIVSYRTSGDLKSVVLWKIERRDSLCVVSKKMIQNFRRKQVIAHYKGYDLGKWEDFKSLVRKKFWEKSVASNTKVFIHYGAHTLYEFKEQGNYKAIEGSNGNPEITWLLDYLEYLISPIFQEKCDR